MTEWLGVIHLLNALLSDLDILVGDKSELKVDEVLAGRRLLFVVFEFDRDNFSKFLEHFSEFILGHTSVSYTHLRAHET